MPSYRRLMLLPLVGALMVAACSATPEQRVRTALLDAGLSPPVAGCMAERLVDRLSIAQLRKLSSLSKLRKADLEQMTVNQFLRRIRALDDPKILRVVTTAGLGCAIAA